MLKTISIYGRALMSAMSLAFFITAGWFFLDLLAAVLFDVEPTGHYLIVFIVALAASIGVYADLITEREAAAEPTITCHFAIHSGGRITFEHASDIAEDIRQAVLAAIDSGDMAVEGNPETDARKAGV